MNWHIQVLGSLALQRGSQIITHFESGRVAVLLAYLALFGQRSHPREELCELLWPEVDPDISRQRLRQALYSLRHQLEPPGVPIGSILIADRHAVRLNPTAFTCDATEFERLVKQRRYAEARALYLGDLLPGYYDDWLLVERYRLEELFESLPPESSAGERAAETLSPLRTGNDQQSGPLPRLERTVALPAYLTEFFGRADEQQLLTVRLACTRLLTLTGLGGIGKTRLATQIGQSVSDRYDRIAFVPLADSVSPAQIPDAIRLALGLPASPASTYEQVVTVCTDSRVLLILDNFEQLVEAGGGVIVETLLARLPALTCLVTSRRVLGVVGEQEFPLSPLPVPGLSDSLTEIASNPGVALFVRRAQAVRPGFHLTEQNHTDVLALCRSLEGIPLALELAASRIRTLAPAEMQQQIQDRFDWLTRSGPGADKEPRQRSLSAAMEWSWRLLSPAHQRFLSALSVFRGGWTAEAAAEVCARADARDLLESLVMDSLLVSEETSEGTTRFRMLDTVGAFVRRHLDTATTSALSRRHQEAFLALAARSESEGRSLLPEAENFVAALDSAILSGETDMAFALCAAVDERWPALVGLRAALTLFHRALHLSDGKKRARIETLRLTSYFTALTGEHQEAWDLAGEAVRRAGADPVERAIALIAQCRVGLTGYRPEDFAERLNEALRLAQTAGESRIAGRARHLLGMAANRRGDFAEAHRHLTEAFALLESVGDRHSAGIALDSLANTAVQRGELDRALELYTLCQERAVTAGNVFYAAKVYQNIATVYGRQERWEASLIAGRECIRRSHALGNDYIIAFALWNLAEPQVFLGQEATAAQLISFTARLWHAQFGPLEGQDLSYQEMILERVSQVLGAEQTQTLVRAGEQLLLSQAIALALKPDSAA